VSRYVRHAKVVKVVCEGTREACGGGEMPAAEGARQVWGGVRVVWCVNAGVPILQRRRPYMPVRQLNASPPQQAAPVFR